jgi:DNA polymerase iota
MASLQDRVVIALDLDAFYVSASRLRDASLIGLPVGIRQKALFATISYEARARGVKKLASIRDGMAMCPEMVVVNGEDLSYFRKVSMQVFKLVSSMVWQGRVEKLGMDELFCDVTEMIDAQMAEYEQNQTETAFPAPVGFITPAASEQQVVNGNIDRLHRYTRKLLLATQLAQKIRSRVAEEVGLTSSAGIASSKLMAKLVGNTHKPNHQTVFAPLNPEQSLNDVQLFLDPYSLRSLNGFGHVIVDKMCSQAAKSIGNGEKDFPSSQLTVALARQIFDWQSLKDMFGLRLATRLYSLLQGQDDEPVIKAPEFPAQISIEDTFRGRGLAGAALLDMILKLSESLLRRLEAELLDYDEKDASKLQYALIEKPVLFDENENLGAGLKIKIRDYEEVGGSDFKPEKYQWKRYPLSVRLSVRQAWGNRVSRQGKMPVEIFDLSINRRNRAQILAHNLESILKAIYASEGDKDQGCNLVNIAALDLSPHRPAKAIGGYFATRKQETIADPAVREQQNIDLAFLKELPPDLRAELAREYNLDLTDDSTTEQDEPLRCEWCGQIQSSWLQHDHARWPEAGLATNGQNEVEWVTVESDDEEISSVY